MKLTALTLVKIDGDVIEEFARHTLRFVDALIVVDNQSPDNTPDILRALAAEGLPLTVWHERIVAENPGITTELARRAFSDSQIDYLLILDADEFIKAESREQLETALGLLARGTHAAVSWANYVPTPEDDQTEPRVLARLRHRRITETKPYSKLFISSSFRDSPKAAIIYGNHGIEDPDGSSKVAPLLGIELAHFPVRSLPQIECKALLGWSMFLAMGYDEKGGLAFQWQRLYEQLCTSPYWSNGEFLRAAWSYLDDTAEGMPEVVCDPIPTVERRYEYPSPDLLRITIAFARQLSKGYAQKNAEHAAVCAQIEAMRALNPEER